MFYITSVPIILKMLIINKAKYLFLGMTFSSVTPNQSVKPDFSHPLARARLPPTKNTIVHGKCFSIIFQVNNGSYLFPLNIFFFGHAHSITSINEPEVVSLTYLYKIDY
jgi:hypothetical protein